MALNFGEGLLSASEEVSGRRPVVPLYDPEASYLKTIKSNIALQPKAQELATLTNRGNAAALDTLLESIYPGFRTAQTEIQSGLAARRRGELSPDVVRGIQDEGAAWGIESGVGASSPMVDYRNLRNYGLSSMALERQGEQDTQSYLDFLRNTLLPSPLDLRDYSINPAVASQDEWNRNWLAEQVLASPDPAAREQMQNKMALMGMILGVYSGGGYEAQPPVNEIGGGTRGGSGEGGDGGFGRWWSNSFGGGGSTQNNYSPGYDIEGYLSDYPGAG